MDSKEEIYGFQIHSQEHDPDFKNTESPQIMHIQTVWTVDSLHIACNIIFRLNILVCCSSPRKRMVFGSCTNNDSNRAVSHSLYMFRTKMKVIQGSTVSSSSQMLTSRL